MKWSRLPLRKINGYKKWLCFLSVFVTLFIIYLTGWFEHPFEISYYAEYSWPLDRPDMRVIIDNFINGKPNPPEVKPVNLISHQFIIENREKYLDKDSRHISPKLMILIKSSIRNTHHRNAIRNTWGHE